METRKRKNRIINWIVILSAIATLVLFLWSLPGIKPSIPPWYQTALVFPTSVDEQIPFSTPYSKYLQMRDSIALIRDLRNGDFPAGSSVTFFNVIGTQNTIFCDTCRLPEIPRGEEFLRQHNKYFITLPGWGIYYNSIEGNYYHQSLDFYVKNHQPYLRENDKDIPVKFIYSHFTKSIMIPVSKQTEQVLYIGISVMIVLALCFAAFLLSCFMYLLVDLSKGKVFTDKNLFRLRLLAIGNLVTPCFVLSGNLLMRLIFNSYFVEGVILNRSVWDELWKITGTGLIFLLIYKAFTMGKQLTEEQELTI